MKLMSDRKLIYIALFKRGDTFSIEGVDTTASLISPVPRNAVPHLGLLFGSFYRRQPNLTYQQRSFERNSCTDLTRCRTI